MEVYYINLLHQIETQLKSRPEIGANAEISHE